MEKMSFCEFMDAVKTAPITPMQALELFNLLYKYMEAVKRYDDADTPESEALERWNMNDRRDEYERFRGKLKGNIPPLLYIRYSIF